MRVLFLSNLKILYRDRLGLFWALLFPLMFIGVFALFNPMRTPEVEIAVVDEARNPFSQALIDNLKSVEVFKVETPGDIEAARQDLKNGQYDMVLVLPPSLGENTEVSATVFYSTANFVSNQVALSALRRFFDEFNLQAASVTPAVSLTEESASTRDVGYMDFLVPGLLGMGVMNYSIIGVATMLVTYHEKRILRRIQVTPLPVAAFLIAQMGAYLVLSMLQTGVILGTGTLAGADLTRQFFWAFPLTLMGNVVFLNLGVVMAGASKTVAAAAGMANAITLPMMFLSGVWFPTDQLPGFLEKAVQYLPLTPLLHALRTVLLDNESILNTKGDLVLMGVWAVVMVLVSSRLFKLE
jgi:ABC-2 type transport system permease protein